MGYRVLLLFLSVHISTQALNILFYPSNDHYSDFKSKVQSNFKDHNLTVVNKTTFNSSLLSNCHLLIIAVDSGNERLATDRFLINYWISTGGYGIFLFEEPNDLLSTFNVTLVSTDKKKWTEVRPTAGASHRAFSGPFGDISYFMIGYNNYKAFHFPNESSFSVLAEYNSSFTNRTAVISLRYKNGTAIFIADTTVFFYEQNSVNGEAFTSGSSVTSSTDKFVMNLISIPLFPSTNCTELLPNEMGSGQSSTLNCGGTYRNVSSSSQVVLFPMSIKLFDASLKNTTIVVIGDIFLSNIKFSSDSKINATGCGSFAGVLTINFTKSTIGKPLISYGCLNSKFSNVLFTNQPNDRCNTYQVVYNESALFVVQFTKKDCDNEIIIIAACTVGGSLIVLLVLVLLVKKVDCLEDIVHPYKKRKKVVPFEQKFPINPTI